MHNYSRPPAKYPLVTYVAKPDQHRGTDRGAISANTEVLYTPTQSFIRIEISSCVASGRDLKHFSQMSKSASKAKIPES